MVSFLIAGHSSCLVIRFLAKEWNHGVATKPHGCITAKAVKFLCMIATKVEHQLSDSCSGRKKTRAITLQG